MDTSMLKTAVFGSAGDYVWYAAVSDANEYIDTTLALLNEFTHEAYYAKMAVAWAISICYINYPDKTFEFLKRTKISPWVFNKSIQKITESIKIGKNLKDKARALRI